MSPELLETLRLDMKKCVRCSLCKLVPMPTIQQTRFTSACPPVDEYHFHAYSGGGMQVMALALLDGRITVDQDLAQIVSACTTCGACDVSCKFIMAAERLDVILALKRHVAEAGLVNPPKKKSESNLTHWADDLKIQAFPESKSDVLLLAGSGANNDAQHAESARKLAKLLLHTRVDFGILADEPVSGIEAYWTGQHHIFAEQAKRLVDQLNSSGAKTIITLCGEDLGMLRSKYPRLNLSPEAEVMHASEFIQTLIKSDKLRLSNPIPLRATYHDPCYLGRQSEPPQIWEGEELTTHGVMRYFVPTKPINYGTNGVFDAPREILEKIPGLSFTEMHRIREYSYCCGGGGGVPDTHPDVAHSAANQRIDEAQDVGAEIVVTACQHCRDNLSRWEEEITMPVVDLVDLVYEAAGLAQ